MSGQGAVVLTPSSEAACGYPFVVGSTYEVHARVTGDYAVTDACSGTRISTRPLPVVGYPTDPVPNRVLPLLVLGVIVIATILAGLVIVGTRINRARRQGTGARRDQCGPSGGTPTLSPPREGGGESEDNYDPCPSLEGGE